ncbi:unnamed protein product [Bursaphelenchus xylophilus]|uniref:(pine wood nematode) hypothetical protein n=1 Tax=Bursaphelenchus xylophilus TaxID=6326 RepID=A0A1I7RZE6_BURXY|nr:unnamed protein product [Bursaphelenchus xylophilus]CAG9106512.1 unnamed protein product [Bursaphelenchus xylophilus]
MNIEKHIRTNYFFLGDFLHLRKMEYLWPISTHPFLYVSHALAAYIVSRELVLSEGYGNLTKRLLIISSAGFLWTRLQQRLSEFHLIVLVLSYFHYLISLSIATGVCVISDKIRHGKTKVE